MKPIRLRTRISLSCLLICFAVLAGTSVLDIAVQKSPVRHLDHAATDYFDRSIGRALATFAVVRGINGVISVIQGTELAISPAGVGVRMAVGQALDPVNDLVERFSWVMLVSTTSLGTQKILMDIGKWLGFDILLTCAAIALLLGMWIPPRSGLNPAPIGIRLFIFAVVIRFCIPTVAYASDRLYDLFLENDFIEATYNLDKIQNQISQSLPFNAAEGKPTGQSGYVDGLKTLMSATGDWLTISQTIAALKEQISDYTQYTVRLIVVFLLQTVLIPILVLWLVLKLLSALCRKPFYGNLAEDFFSFTGSGRAVAKSPGTPADKGVKS